MGRCAAYLLFHAHANAGEEGLGGRLSTGSTGVP